MARPGGHAEHSGDPRNEHRRPAAVSRAKLLLALAVAVGAGGLLTDSFRQNSGESSGTPRDSVLLSVAEPGSKISPGESQLTKPPSADAAPHGEHRTPQTPDHTAAPDMRTSGERSGTDDSATTDDQRLRKLIVGTWQQSYYGKRLLTVLPDGQAKMVIRPDSVWAFAFGQQIDLDMFWSIENGRIDYGYKGGTPEDKVALAAKTWGDRWDEKILELTDSRLVLLCSDGETRSEWERASTEKSPPAVSKDRSSAKPE